MTKITEDEPGHWHCQDEHGDWRHAMPDPRRLGPKRTHWSPDEQAYAVHLDQHDFHATSPQPRHDDDPLVRATLDYINNKMAVLEGVRTMAVLLRQELASGVALEETRSAPTLKTWLAMVMGDTAGEKAEEVR